MHYLLDLNNSHNQNDSPFGPLQTEMKEFPVFL